MRMRTKSSSGLASRATVAQGFAQLRCGGLRAAQRVHVRGFAEALNALSRSFAAAVKRCS